jgi:hypothetical protein
VWRYFFLTQPFDLPERLIGSSPEFYLRWTLDEWCSTPGARPGSTAVGKIRPCHARTSQTEPERPAPLDSNDGSGC